MNLTEEAYGDWFKSLGEWEWFATFTFEYETSPKTANRLWREQWLRELEKSVGGQVHFIRVTENTYDNIHYHCLLNGVKDEKPSVWERRWRDIGGIAKIEPYDASGGDYYLGSKCSRGDEIAFSKHINRAAQLIESYNR